MAENNNFKSTVEALFQGMDGVDLIEDGSWRCDPCRGYHSASACGCFIWNRGRFFPCRKAGKRNGWNWRKDYSERSACDQAWHHQAGQCEKSGYDDQNSGYGSGSGGSVHRKKEDKVTEADVSEILDGAEKAEEK